MKSKIKKPSRKTTKQKDPNRYSKGWNRKKVQRVIDHYENQTDDEAIAEDEAAYNNPSFTMMQVPNELVPRVQKLISKRAG
ncbi:MAG TPA: hypothetical protein VHX86_15120 [Tepidisphaeraceae bacterium]|jgi:hypothetical protein|nr:hypothetical protein [Tepidisphaeraceae bacterium]